MNKRAVVVGINDYSAQRRLGWDDLRGAVTDAQAMYHVLVNAFRFDPSQIWLYTNARARSATIRQAIRYMLSISEPGDVACLFYAGHGGLHPFNETTYYQTIVPHSGRYLTDWDLWAAAERLQPSQVNFTVILDSGHARGRHEETEQPGAVRAMRYPPEFVERAVTSLRRLIPFGVTVPGPEAYTDNVSNIHEAENGVLCMDEDPEQQLIPSAKSVLFTACRWDEEAQEISTPFPHGFFTQAFLDIVDQGDFLIDHRSMHQALIDRVQQLGGPSQTPQLRGRQDRVEEDFLGAWTDSH